MLSGLKTWLGMGVGGTGNRKRARLSSRLSVEPLEAREVPALLAWVGSNGGYWSSASNWLDLGTSAHRTPVPTDTLAFGLYSNNNSSINDISNLTVAAVDENNTFSGTILVADSADTFTVTGTWESYGTVQVEYQAYLDVGAIYLYGDLEVEAGPAALAPAVTTSILDAVGGSSFTIGGASGSTLDRAIDSVVLAGGATWTIEEGIGVDLAGEVGSSGTITLEEGASLSVSGDLSIAAGGELNLNNYTTLSVGGASPTLLAGTANVSGNVTIAANELQVSGFGTLNISGGTLTIVGSLNNVSGTIQFVQAVASLNVTGNFTQYIGNLNLVLADGAANQISIDGTASLGGDITFDGYDDAPIISIFLIASSGVSGTFASVTFTDLHPLLSGSVDYYDFFVVCHVDF